MANALEETIVKSSQFQFHWAVSGTDDVILEIEFFETPGADVQSAYVERVRKFCACGAYGAFPVSSAKSTQSSLIFNDVIKKTNTVLVFNLKSKFVDSACLGILANLIRGATKKIYPARQITAYSKNIGTRQNTINVSKPNFENVRDYYPLGAIKLSFTQEDDDSEIDVHKNRRCLIIAKERYTEEMILEFVQRIMTWVVLLEEGGYALPVRPAAEAMVIFESLELYTENILELTISLFEASEQSWLSLFSILDCLSKQVNQLEGVWLS